MRRGAGGARGRARRGPDSYIAERARRMQPAAERGRAMSAGTSKELLEMTARLLAIARKLPPGQHRYNVVQHIRRFRGRVASLKGPNLEPRANLGMKAKPED